MKESNLVKLLGCFSKPEVKEFSKFIISPYFNTGKKYVVLFLQELLKFYPEFEITRHSLFELLYPGKKYNDVTMRKLISEGSNIAEDFLTQKLVERDPLKNELMLLKDLSNRKVESAFNSKLKEISADINGKAGPTAVRPARKKELEEVLKFHYSFRDRKRSLQHYNSEMEWFAADVVENLLALYIERLTEKKNFSEMDFSMPFFDEVIKITNAGKFSDIPVISIHFNHVMMLHTGEWQYYQTLKSLKEEYYTFLNTNELKNIYVGLMNFVVEKSELNEISLAVSKQELFVFYSEILQRGLIEQFFSEFLFLNIVTVSLQLGQSDFAAEFIDKYSKLLNPETRKDVVNFCRANILYFKGSYGEALSLASRINFKYYQQKLLVRNLTIKIYFDQNESTAFGYQVSAYRTYLKRERTIPGHLQSVIDGFLGYTVKLFELKNRITPPSEIQGLKEDINSSPAAEKFWLLEKAEELLSRSSNKK